MRWNNKIIEHKNGDTKIVIKYAYLPKACISAVIWLEKYESHQRYNALYDLWLEQSAVVID